DHQRRGMEVVPPVPAVDSVPAFARLGRVHGTFSETLEQRSDAILTPAAPGTAPKGLTSTGEPIFSTLWTLCGMPAVSVPLMQGENGLPLGVQLVGPRDGDARLLRTARWLVRRGTQEIGGALDPPDTSPPNRARRSPRMLGQVLQQCGTAPHWRAASSAWRGSGVGCALQSRIQADQGDS